MRNFLTLVRELPLAVKVLLLCAATRALSFFAVNAYMPIFLHTTVGMGAAGIGFVLGVCLLVGTLVSVYGGYLADRFVKVDFMIALDVLLALLYAALPAIRSPVAVIGVLLVSNVASSSMSVAANALLSELTPARHRTKAFSLRYSLQNIGAAVGPFLGVTAVGAGSGGPFVAAAAVIVAALVPLAVLRRHFLPSAAPTADASGTTAGGATPGGATADADADAEPGFRAVLRQLRADRRLRYFTLGGILSIVVYGPLLTFMSQYLVTVEPEKTAYRLVAYISAANAVVVIGTQYLLGSRLRQETLMRWLTWGTAAFAVGLAAMSLSTDPLLLVAAVAVFTLGEVVVVPAEYMFIDSIAPGNLRGSYFGAQNLVHIGVAVGPAACGFLLTAFSPGVMFAVLVAIAVAGWWFYLVGCRAATAAARTSAPEHLPQRKVGEVNEA